MKFGIVVFPGTWSDVDSYQAVKAVLGQEAAYVWHKDTKLSGLDCLILPGGFSYGDYLRPGAIARFSPVMDAVEKFAKRGGLVIGICNGFQVLCEAGLLPGALMRNEHLQFRCEWINLRIENSQTPFTKACHPGQVISIPISHGEGSYYADEPTLDKLLRQNRIVFRYSTCQGQTSRSANPNGSIDNIAGVINEEGNVLGMMPHPERACEDLLGGTDGLLIFKSILLSVGEASGVNRNFSDQCREAEV